MPGEGGFGGKFVRISSALPAVTFFSRRFQVAFLLGLFLRFLLLKTNVQQFPRGKRREKPAGSDFTLISLKVRKKSQPRTICPPQNGGESDVGSVKCVVICHFAMGGDMRNAIKGGGEM